MSQNFHNIRIKQIGEKMKKSSKSDNHVLAQEAKDGNIKRVYDLIDKGADINCAVKVAAGFDQRELLVGLLDKGGDINIATKLAAYNNRQELLTILIRNYNADLDIAVRSAAFCERRVLTHKLLEMCKTTDIILLKGSAIFAAACGNHPEFVNELIESESDESNKNYYLMHAVEGASQRNHHQLVNQLLHRGACLVRAVIGAAYGNQLPLIAELILCARTEQDASTLKSEVLKVARSTNNEYLINWIQGRDGHNISNNKNALMAECGRKRAAVPKNTASDLSRKKSRHMEPSKSSAQV